MPAEFKFLPGIPEIYSRAEAIRWMTLMGWGEDLMDQIFVHDSPDVETVRRLVYTHGPIKAHSLIRSFIE